MKAQRDELLNSSTKYGWQVIDIEEFENVPFSGDWVDELWIIESFWRPIGFRSFIFFLLTRNQTSKAEKANKFGLHEFQKSLMKRVLARIMKIFQSEMDIEKKR